jgi:hypothetical protein
MDKLYTHTDEEVKKKLSLNFLLSEEVGYDSSSIRIRETEKKSNSTFHNTNLFMCFLFNKHISRYIDNVDLYSVENL